MPSLPIYMDESDFGWLHSWLNDEPEIAWIISDGPKRWRAVITNDDARQGTYCLWHIPSGPLPLFEASSRESMVVGDPWGGWVEKTTGAEPSKPYWGPGHPGVIWLDARMTSKLDPNAIGMSSFGWIGNHYRIIGNGASEATSKWWQRPRRQIKKCAVQIPREGPTDSPHNEIWALPSALERIKDGARRDANPTI